MLFRNNHNSLICCLLLLLIAACNAYVARMLHGRPRGGFVGKPGTEHHGANFKQGSLPSDQWFSQKLDHFNGADTRFWKQRYFTNDAFYEHGGPLFVQIGGEGTANPIWMAEGAWIQYAKKYKAYCVLLEHRFYGKSHPTEDMKDENLQFLSSEQALADLARFITYLSGKLSNPPVITFGGSYPGSLSAWFRMKYPHLVTGAVASSAPLLAKINFIEYLEVVEAALHTYSPSADSCNQAVKAATDSVADLLQSLKGRTILKEKFRLCDSIDPNLQKDISNLLSTLAGNFENVVQYNKDNRGFEGGKGANITIDTLCDIMTKGKGEPLDRYAQVNAMLLDVYEEKCQDFKYDKMIDTLKRTDWNSSAAEGGRQWTYQTCTEFAFYQSSDYTNQPFGHAFPINFWIEQCSDIFGDQFTETMIAAAVARSNIDYGALGIKVSRILFPNGSIDPWHALGVLRDIGPDARAIFINGTAHCANMYPPSPNDLPGLVQARAEIDRTIGIWLSSHASENKL